MKRLLIAAFCIISLVTLAAVATNQTGNSTCKKPVCCKVQPKESNAKTDYIFWQPVNRLMMVTK